MMEHLVLDLEKMLSMWKDKMDAGISVFHEQRSDAHSMRPKQPSYLGHWPDSSPEIPQD